jgi:hypothetical protein
MILIKVEEHHDKVKDKRDLFVKGHDQNMIQDIKVTKR